MAETTARNPNLPPEYVTLKQLQQLRLEKKQVEEAAVLEKPKEEEEELQEKRPPKASKPLQWRSKPKAPHPQPAKATAVVQSPDPKPGAGSDDTLARRRRSRGGRSGMDGRTCVRADGEEFEMRGKKSTARNRRGTGRVKFEEIGGNGLVWVPKST
ncbi:hypothetical protein J5N97_000784 [Dioscorea zingiberensis]|uniref:Uncharacterized protein n=1 Tax=Dioscorea zingiberensis TaxID=325984 RepID=A0A9D5BVA5_9LILI|nr:hypothetical protein J5N97_000784 [Dioscorea zingiberensis]